MTNQEIKDRAPDGATHYRQSQGYTLYYRDDVYALWLYISRLEEWVITKYRLHDLTSI